MTPAAQRHPTTRQFASSYPTVESLLDAVRDVSLVARPELPTEVTTRAFDDARQAAGHPLLPSARAICKRLGRRGAPMPWAKVLERAHDPATSPVMLGAAISRAAEAPHMTVEHIVFGLRLVARRRDLATLTPGDYEVGWQGAIAEDRRRFGGGLLEEILPTANQVQKIAERESEYRGEAAWDWALAIAELDPRPVTKGGRAVKAMPRHVAIAWFVRTCGYAYRPTPAWLEEWSRIANVSVAKGQKLWAGEIEDAAELLRLDGGHEMPAAAPPPKAELEFTFPQGGIPGATPRYLRAIATWKECVSQMRVFVQHHPSGGTRQYKQWTKSQPERPNISKLTRYSGFATIRRIAGDLNRTGQPTPDGPEALATNAQGTTPTPAAAAASASGSATPGPGNGTQPHRAAQSGGSVIASLPKPVKAAGRPRDALRLLIEHGTLRAGQELRLTRKGVTHTATLTADGKVQLPGHAEALSPSAAAAKLTGFRTANGWEWWKAEINGKYVPLNRLRSGGNRESDNPPRPSVS
jgi:hypothetical protein